jgi:hypothetical protein
MEKVCGVPGVKTPGSPAGGPEGTPELTVAVNVPDAAAFGVNRAREM